MANGTKKLQVMGSLGASSSIIDVTALPETDINENAFYRMVTGTFVYNRYPNKDWPCYCVEALPEIGEPVTTDMVNVTAYYNTADGDVYGYINETLAAQAGVTAGWYTLATLAPLFDVSWGGVITNITDDPMDDTFRLLLEYTVYSYKDGWTVLNQSFDWNAAEGEPGHVLNRTHYTEPPKFDIQWDGDMTGRFALDMSQLGYDEGLYFVKVSDEVLTEEEVVSGKYHVNTDLDSATITIYEEDVYTTSYPGAISIRDYIIICYAQAELNAALGLPDGYITNGTYFYCYTSDEEHWYITRLVGPEIVHPLEYKYLPDNVLTEYDMSGYAKTSDLSSYAKTSDLSSYVTTSTMNSRLSSYVTTSTMNSELNSYAKTSVLSSYLGLDYNKQEIVIPGETTNNDYWRSGCYGNGKFVAVGKDGLIAYSEDGITWMEAELPNAKYYIVSACYGNGKFVGLLRTGASTRMIVYSEDGVTWTEGIELGVDIGPVSDICYGNGKFVAVGVDARIVYSEDGVTWTEANTSSRYSISSVCYGNGKFVATHSVYSTSLFYSEDGANWTTDSSFKSGLSLSICYGNGKFVAVGKDGFVAYSEDGITLQNGVYPSPAYLLSVCYGNGKFVAVGKDGACGYSEDGVNWTESNISTNDNLISVCYGNGKFVVVGEDGHIAYSEDGVTWVMDYNTSPKMIFNSSTDVTADTAEVIKPYLNLTSADLTSEQLAELSTLLGTETSFYELLKSIITKVNSTE